MTDNERKVSETPDEIRELLDAEEPKWDGTIPDGQICQSLPDFTFNNTDEEELEYLDQLIMEGIPNDCKNNATLGFETVYGSNDGPFGLIWYLCENCGEHFRQLYVYIPSEDKIQY